MTGRVRKTASHRATLRNRGYDDALAGRPMNERLQDEPEYRTSYKRGQEARAGNGSHADP